MGVDPVDGSDPAALRWFPAWRPSVVVPALLLGDDRRDQFELPRTVQASLPQLLHRDGFSLPWKVSAILSRANDGQDAIKPHFTICLEWKTHVIILIKLLKNVLKISEIHVQ